MKASHLIPRAGSRGVVSAAVAIAMAAASVFAPGAVQAQTATFSEEFDAPLSYPKWFYYDTVNPKGRTYYGNQGTLLNENGVSFVRLKMDAWNPEHPGYFKGTVLASTYRYAQGTFEARMRISFLKAGAIYAFFPYGQSAGTPGAGDEIDFEMLGNYGASNKIWLNTYNDGTSAQSQGFTPPTTASNVTNFGTWHTFKAVWSTSAVNWYIDGVLVRTLANSIAVPTFDRLAPYLEVWSPSGNPNDPNGGYFPEAYNPNLLPATSPAGNYTMLMDVDWVHVYQGATTATASRVRPNVSALSAGNGLTAPDGSIINPSPLLLSGVTVEPGFNNRIRLTFSGDVSPKDIPVSGNYILSINGMQAHFTGAQLVDRRTVTVDLDRPFAPGNTVMVAAYNLTDTSGRMLNDQISTVVVPAATS